MTKQYKQSGGNVHLYRHVNSPYWYVRLYQDGQASWISTKQTDKSKAETAAKLIVSSRKQRGSLEDIFRDLYKLIQGLEPTERTRTSHDFAARLLRRGTEALKIADTWQAWKDSPRKGNPGTGTCNGYESCWNRFTNWLPKKTEYLHEVSEEMAEDYAADLWRSNVAPRTFNLHMTFLKSLFHHMGDRAGLPLNPWQKVRTLNNETISRENFSPEELQTMCQKAKGSFRYMIGLGIYTGLRLNDVVHLQRSNIKKDRIVIVPHKTRRNGKAIEIPIHPVLAELLAELLKTVDGDLLFPREAKLYDEGGASMITREFQAFLGECGITTQRKPDEGSHRQQMITVKGYHSLRHSFVSLCAAHRVPLVAIQDLVGHSSPSMTQHYQHPEFALQQQAIRSLPAFRRRGRK